MSTVREQLIELFYDNNVHCDQTIEHLVDDVTDIINDSKIVLPDTIKSIDASAFDGCSKKEATCKDCIHFEVCCDNWAQQSEHRTAEEYARLMDNKVPCRFFKDSDSVIVSPYKVGDTVWEIDADNPFEEELRVVESKVEKFYMGTSHNLHCIDYKTVFPTKEEAQEALKGARNEKV